MNDTLSFMAWLHKRHTSRPCADKYPLIKADVLFEILKREEQRKANRAKV